MNSMALFPSFGIRTICRRPPLQNFNLEYLRGCLQIVLSRENRAFRGERIDKSFGALHIFYIAVQTTELKLALQSLYFASKVSFATCSIIMGERPHKSLLTAIQDVASFLQKAAKHQENLSRRHINRIKRGTTPNTLTHAVENIAKLLRKYAKTPSRIEKKGITK
jgi:hypothetical protein